MIRAGGLSKAFRAQGESVVAVRDLDLHVREGEFVCIMGASGCGKSTLLNLLAGVFTPDAGEVAIDGNVISRWRATPRAAFRLERVGMVFQRDGLIDEFTARENVALPMEMIGRPEAEAGSLAMRALEAVGMEDLAARRPRQMSGGQRQRVGIARGIVGTRSVLLADEATGALDHANSQRVFALFRDLARAGTTVVAATHDRLAGAYADRTLHMVDGSVDEVAS